MPYSSKAYRTRKTKNFGQRRTILSALRLEDQAMTVCIAAICESSLILGASDRMLTTADIEYEPKDQPKIQNLTDHILVMFAGSTNVHSELMVGVATEFKKDISKTWRVGELATIYNRLFWEFFDKRSEQQVLAPRSMTHTSFLLHQKNMPDARVMQIDQELSTFSLSEYDGVEAIFAGHDDLGAHIFVFRNGRVSCNDLTGYAAIGTGGNLAHSQFTFAKHSRQSGAARTLYTLWKAKKMAESASGVGKETDVVVMADKIMPLHNDLIPLLTKTYLQDQKLQEKRFLSVEEKIKKNIAKRTTPASPITSSTGKS